MAGIWKGSRGRRSLALAVLIVTLATVVPAYWYARMNGAAITWDEAEYAVASIDLFSTLFSDPERWLNLMLGGFGAKAPAIFWIGQFFLPLKRIVGSVEVALALEVILAAALSALTFFSFLSRLTNASARFASLLLFVSAPLFWGLSHFFLVEVLQLLAVCICLYHIERAKSRVQLLAGLSAATAFGLLTKVSFPLYVLVPSLWALACARRLPWYSHTWRHLLLISFGTAVFCGAVSLWYWYNRSLFSTHVFNSTLGPNAYLFGAERPFIEKIVRWAGFSATAFFLNSFLAGAFFLLVIGAALRCSCRPRRGDRLDAWLPIAGLQLLLVLTTLCLQVNEEERFLLPALPYVILLIAWGLRQIPLAAFAAGTAACYQLLILLLFSFGPLSRAWVPMRWVQAATHDATLRNEHVRLVDFLCRADSGRSNYIGYVEGRYSLSPLRFYGRISAFSAQCNLATLGLCFSGTFEEMKRAAYADGVGYLVFNEKLKEPPLCDTERNYDQLRQLLTNDLSFREIRAPVPGVVVFVRESNAVDVGAQKLL